MKPTIIFFVTILAFLRIGLEFILFYAIRIYKLFRIITIACFNVEKKTSKNATTYSATVGKYFVRIVIMESSKIK
jgi:hypothetical protein